MNKNQFTVLQKFKGELDGNYTSLYVAADVNRQLYVTYNIEFDFDKTSWTSISNERYSKISDEMVMTHESFLNKEKTDLNVNEQINSISSNLKLNQPMEKKEDVSITGNIGSIRFTRFPSGKSKIDFVLGEKGNWKHITAFNNVADKLNEAHEKEGAVKLEVKGNTWQPVKYEDKKGKTVEYDELMIREFKVLGKTLEISGNIAKVENKVTKNEKALTELFVVNNSNGETYNVTIWENQKKGIPEDVKLEVGKPIAIKGFADILTFKTGKESYSIEAWNVDLNPDRLKTQIENLKQAKAGKNAAAAASKEQTATTKKESSKGQELSL